MDDSAKEGTGLSMLGGARGLLEHDLAVVDSVVQVLGLIGEQFDVGNEICGAVISIRAQEDILSVWNRNSENTDATAKIRCALKCTHTAHRDHGCSDQLRRLLKLPHHVTMEYKKHQDSIVDKSSFRNTATFRT
jgi:translation initiation factor 4E